MQQSEWYYLWAATNGWTAMRSARKRVQNLSHSILSIVSNSSRQYVKQSQHLISFLLNSKS